MPSTCGLSCRHSAPGAAVTDTKSRPKKTPSTAPVEKIASASGEAPASSAAAKSRVPASITFCPGRNFRVEGLGVVSVWISMRPMWPRAAGGSTSAGSAKASEADLQRREAAEIVAAAAPERAAALDLERHAPAERQVGARGDAPVGTLGAVAERVAVDDHRRRRLRIGDDAAVA